jgi:hypothetical protein
MPHAAKDTLLPSHFYYVQQHHIAAERTLIEYRPIKTILMHSSLPDDDAAIIDAWLIHA